MALVELASKGSRTSGAPAFHAFRSPVGAHLLVIESSQVFDLPDELARGLDAGDEAALRRLEPYLESGRRAGVHALAEVAPQSLSLNVSSSCNLSCSYCYAGRGSFGGAQPRPMPWPTARAAIDRLLSGCDAGAPATLGFLGGEPFVNAALIHRAVRYASARGRALGVEVRFSVTTNGTLLSAADLELLRRFPFAVTVSVDGGREVYERQRRGGRFEKLAERLAPLLADPGRAMVSARATITRETFALTERFDAIRALGFADVGFSPVRVGPGGGALRGADWSRCLEAYRELGTREARELAAGRKSAFSNLVVALEQIHRGACSPYPCGAGGGYFSVAADGTWYACHRAVGDDRFALGDPRELFADKRAAFLRDRHVDRQTDCRGCWARYLCSGSCHQEARARTPASCDFIRGWLDFCLATYCALTARNDWDSIMGAYDERS